ncbi:MAG: hypothetical protein AAGB07_00705 [Pseudomonadota bacterium]
MGISVVFALLSLHETEMRAFTLAAKAFVLSLRFTKNVLLFNILESERFMSGTLGSRLGGFLAHFEQTMMDDGCSDETLCRIHQISEVYRNLADANLGDFRTDFKAGYEAAVSSINHDLDRPLSDLGDSFPGPQRD